jgi:hypothetical protein
MFDALSNNEKVNTGRIELIDALEYHRKIFSSYYKLESTFEDLSIDFHNLNDKTYDFIRVAIRHIVELEKIVEKYESPKFKYLATHT